MKKNVAIIIEHTLPRNVPGIRPTSIHSKGDASHRDHATTALDRRRSQPSAEQVSVRVAGRKTWRLETQNTYTAVVAGTRMPGTRYVVPGIF